MDDLNTLLGIRGQRLGNLAVVLPEDNKAWEYDRSNAPPISALPSILMDAESAWDLFALSTHMNVDVTSASTFRFECQQLVHARKGCRAGNRPGRQIRERRCSDSDEVVRMSLSIYTSLPDSEQINLNFMLDLLIGYQLLFNSFKTALDLHFSFEQPWLHDIFHHWVSRQPDYSNDDLRPALASATIDGWWYPGDVFGWVDE